ncbi:MAG: glycerophosphodiester phosphodiesterase family protein, partial [Promethearchaeota archaeon]
IKDISFSSFHLSSIKKLRKKLPGICPQQFILLAKPGLPIKHVKKKLEKLRILAISIPRSKINQDLIKQLHQDNFKVLAYGLNDKNLKEKELQLLYKSLIKIGLDGFTCAYPNILKFIKQDNMKLK